MSSCSPAVWADANLLYGAIEVGRIIRSRDGGEHWENLSHGQYLNDDPVDSTASWPVAGALGRFSAWRGAGMFRSTDWGDHWLRVQIKPLNAKDETYCRSIREVPRVPKTIWVSAGANFQSDMGALFRNTDGGLTWKLVDMGAQPKTTMFGLAFDERNRKRVESTRRASPTRCQFDRRFDHSLVTRDDQSIASVD